MNDKQDFNAQFFLGRGYYLQTLDFLNWFRYYHLIKDILRLEALNILEIGSGSGIVKNCIKPLVQTYTVLDINPNLDPDIDDDERVRHPELEERFDCIIAADVLEHIPFADLARCAENLYGYLKSGGKALITIPHRQSNFLFIRDCPLEEIVAYGRQYGEHNWG